MDFNANLTRASIDLVVLAALAEGSAYGYLLLKRIHDASRSRHRVTAGTLYPILHELESEGAVSSRWESVGERRRKWYDLTAKGRRRLQQDADEWRAFVSYVERLLRPALQSA